MKQENIQTSKHAEKLSELVKQFSEKDMTEVIKYTYLKYANDVPSAKWSFGNKCLMFLQGTRDARGYKQWEQVERHVKKGSKAVYIMVPRIIKIEDDDNTNKKKDAKKTTTTMAGFMLRPVFRYEDTDGKPLELEGDEPEMPPLAEIASKWGISIRHAQTGRGESGHFNPKEKEIVLCVRDNATFFHELAHAAHERVLKRSGKELKNGQDVEQETVAELSAAVIGSMYGLENAGQSFTYIKSYMESKSHLQVAKMCMKVFGEVEQVLDEIFSQENIVE